MRGKRKRFQASFKAKVALAALKSDRTTSQLTAAFSVHATQISQWKKQLLDGAAERRLWWSVKYESIYRHA